MNDIWICTKCFVQNYSKTHSSYDSFSFKLAKEISNVRNKTLLPNGNKGTLDFVTKLKNLKLSGHFKMLSLDIESFSIYSFR